MLCVPPREMLRIRCVVSSSHPYADVTDLSPHRRECVFRVTARGPRGSLFLRKSLLESLGKECLPGCVFSRRHFFPFYNFVRKFFFFGGQFFGLPCYFPWGRAGAWGGPPSGGNFVWGRSPSWGGGAPASALGGVPYFPDFELQEGSPGLAIPPKFP